jgi:hypothetical protein
MAVTTPDTSAVRAWARKNGYDVADRGRLPAEVQDAYVAAHRKGSGGVDGGSGQATRKPAVPAKKAAAEPRVPARPAVEDRDRTSSTTPRPKPSPVTDDRRLVALGEELSALSDRVAALEAASGGRSGSKSGSTSGSKSEGMGSRFRRSR